MIGASRINRRGQWLQALVVSLVLHGAAIAGLVYDGVPLPDLGGDDAPPRLTVETLTPQGPAPAMQDGSDVVEPVAPAQPLTPVSPPEVLTATPAPDLPQGGNDWQAPVVTTGAAQWAVTTAAMPELVPQDPAMLPPDAPTESADDSGGPPLDPRLAGLIARIRDQFDTPCLLALPLLIGEDEVQLSVLAADDRQIGDFLRDITADLDQDIPDRSILLDRRQCPGLTFARRARDYPVFGLSIQLDSADIASGGALTGRIGNGAGHYNTLLLVDDNGVVQDLRRFLTVQGGEVSFDVPLARVGSARDTNQLLIAIATRDRIQSVTANAGRLAADFFPALIAELGDSALIGVGSVYVR